MYDTTSAFVYFFHLNGDTLSYSLNNISYSNVSVYQENGNNFSIVDLAGSLCSDTGHYTFAIQSDTLKFTLVYDSCYTESRPPVFYSFHWVRLTTGIEENAFAKQVSVFPNPLKSQTTISFSEAVQNATIQIRDLLGSEVKTIHFTGKQYILEKEEMNAGIYFVQITDEKKNSILKKVIVE